MGWFFIEADDEGYLAEQLLKSKDPRLQVVGKTIQETLDLRHSSEYEEHLVTAQEEFKYHDDFELPEHPPFEITPNGARIMLWGEVLNKIDDEEVYEDDYGF